MPLPRSAVSVLPSLDNLQKAVFDSLTHAGFMLDDEQIDDFRVRRGEVVKGGSLDIFITELEMA